MLNIMEAYFWKFVTIYTFLHAWIQEDSFEFLYVNSIISVL